MLFHTFEDLQVEKSDSRIYRCKSADLLQGRVMVSIFTAVDQLLRSNECARRKGMPVIEVDSITQIYGSKATNL